ncbi:hypothetical protein ASPZODRAFT_108681 [Penicilliopsis zonata CBS 506.65]|uniref:Phospholipase C n=1 Tax=Penicilliopsis zonata CBS 506.65 TaxID=1073090 RepID=A0A1L9SX59_9EURO|nr:hypothetical protein ASPZODRAFT_108681 [Penicilliopsis zonata CBS 506.65]OJJ51727.1 hypothetical protein ASPZODRAFT_108681 [Penicilliopsis zonata CBS 506.65]
MLMQENRSFMHYFATMAGVRGFADPNVQINENGKSVWYQNVSTLTDATDWLLPFWLNYEGGDWHNRTMCMSPGSNEWLPTQEGMNNGTMDQWAVSCTPQAWGYFKREDIPFHYAMADAWTVGDMYTAGVMSATDPNRWMWQSGSINVPGGPQPLGAGGVVLDDNQTPGCEGTNLNCVPLDWPPTAEIYDKAGVDWRGYMNEYDYVTNNGLFYFKSMQEAATNSSLYERGLAFSDRNSLEGFYADAANGTLPEVSWIFPPGAVNEHPPHTPGDGAWFMKKIVDAVTHGPNWDSTVLIICYDEGGGFGDPIWPYHSPRGTAGEWLEDPYGELGYTFAGPGIRVPIFIISPWTRGGKVFTEHTDHNSQILFVEEFLKAKGYENVVTAQMSEWRRNHMSNLLNAFDWDNPDYSVPSLPQAPHPYTDSDGEIVGTYVACEAYYSDVVPTIPYGNQTLEDALYYEDGFKSVRGNLTEGRYLVFEIDGYALAAEEESKSSNDKVTVTAATSTHEGLAQRWVLHVEETGTTHFTISSALDGRYIGAEGKLVTDANDAVLFDIAYIGGGKYTITVVSSGKHLYANKNGVSFNGQVVSFDVYSVTYH